jgi:hypothetical protein
MAAQPIVLNSDGTASLYLYVPTLAAPVLITLPATTGTLALINAINTFIGQQQFTILDVGTPPVLAECPIMVFDTNNGVVQLNLSNLSTGTSASADLVASNNAGSDAVGFINLGKNSTNNADPSYTVMLANDSYLYDVDGNLNIGTATAGKNIRLFTGGTLLANLRALVNDAYSSLLYGGSAGVQAALGGVLWTKTVSTTLASWTTASSILNGATPVATGVLPGSSNLVVVPALPTNFFTVGRKLIIKASGVCGAAATAPTLTATLTLSGTVIATTGAVVLLNNNMTNATWEAEFEITCRTVGVSGVVFGHGNVHSCSDTSSWDWDMGTFSAVPVTVNTQNALTPDLLFACGTSSSANTYTCSQAHIEVKG